MQVFPFEVGGNQAIIDTIQYAFQGSLKIPKIIQGKNIIVSFVKENILFCFSKKKQNYCLGAKIRSKKRF